MIGHLPKVWLVSHAFFKASSKDGPFTFWPPCSRLTPSALGGASGCSFCSLEAQQKRGGVFPVTLFCPALSVKLS